MQTIDALICPRWTIRVEPEVVAEEGLSLAVSAGRIIEVLPLAAAERRYLPRVRHDRQHHALLPGLVNAHTHAAMTLLRGFADDVPFERWLRELVWPAESRWVAADFVADGTRAAVAEMLLGGTTCFSDMYYYPDIAGEVAAELKMRAVVGMIVLDSPTPWAASADEYFRKGLEVHDRFRAEPLVTTAFAPHAPYSVGDATLVHVRRLADELDLPIHMHLHETRSEVDAEVAATGRRPLDRLASLGLVTPALIGVHATELVEPEIAALAAAGASVVHCPRSNLKLATGLCPVQRLLDAGVNVALGTDGAASNNRLDLWSEMQMAALLAKHAAADAGALPARQALAMATLNGARAIGLGSEIGSLVAGKAADLICVDLSGIEHRPLLDPISALVYAASRHDVTDVWIAGEHLVADRSPLRFDVAEIASAADAWGERLRTEA